MNYNTLSSFAQTWGLLYFVLMFVIALVYALWPSNKKTFEAASQIPLEDREISDDR
ncbi:cbb3-type cytochrome c oxidase subunit 3 [Hirschia litorea]|uniref:Cbb3-type cytochrome c oxidase subunit 3 n=1 Tax=Hirschia litorea TaxID=1199156 RepID=A0ABW2IHJ0_9PROT